MNIPLIGEVGDVPPILLLLILSVYIASPIDFIPDFLPVIGWIDDFIALIGAGIVMFNQFRGKK